MRRPAPAPEAAEEGDGPIAPRVRTVFAGIAASAPREEHAHEPRPS